MKNEKSYIFNLETTKIELVFDKAEYDAFSEEQKRKLNSAYLFSGKRKRWVSRAKEPNLFRAIETAASFGFTKEERIGERISYSEQLDRQAERAEERADRYTVYSQNAKSRADALQKPLKDKHGDIAFFTQPIIAGHSGSQAFAKAREKIYSKYEKGFDEYRKSEYFSNRASIARGTASMKKLNDKGYLMRKITGCKSEIRKRRKNIEEYELRLKRLEDGEHLIKWNQDSLTIEEVSSWLYRELELIEVAQDKEGFFLNCLDELGGITFSKDDIKVGYFVSIGRWGLVEVTGRGQRNISYKILTGGAAGMRGKASYAEIKEVKKMEENKERHPFLVGETYIAKGFMKEVVYEIVKISDKTIQLKEKGSEKKPIKRKTHKNYEGKWYFFIDDRMGNTFYKEPVKA